MQLAAAPEVGELLVTALADGVPVLAGVVPHGPGVDIAASRQMDGRMVYRVTLAGAVPSRIILRGDRATAAFSSAMDHAIAAACAEALGIGTALFDRTLDYVRTRRQFGAAIGSFQVVQHRLVDAHIALEEARSLCVMACKTLEDASADPVVRGGAVSAARRGVIARCLKVARDAIQLHGGIGMTEELPVGRGFRRLRTLAVLYGDDGWHLQRIMAARA